MIWSIALAAGGVLGLYLAGRKNLWGWAIGLAMQALWIAYALVTAQYGFLLSAAAYGWVYGLNLVRWRRAEGPHERQPCVRCGRCLCERHRKPRGRWVAPSEGGYHGCMTAEEAERPIPAPPRGPGLAREA